MQQFVRFWHTTESGRGVYLKIVWMLLLGPLILCKSIYAAELKLDKSEALQCLTRTPNALEKIEYPSELLERKMGDTVRVELIFHNGHSAPTVRFLDEDAARDFMEVVSDFVAGYRVPCMRAEMATVRLRQDYVFSPTDGRKILQSRPQDTDDEQRKEKLQCLKNINSLGRPSYPSDALSKELEGKYYVRVRFASADAPPAVEWLASAGENSLKRSVAHYLEGLRLPCLNDEPISFTTIYEFVMADSDWTVLKDMDLKTFLSSIKDIPRPAVFDLDDMSCPFDLRVQYLNPFALNQIDEIETSNINRIPLIEWLAKMRLNVPASMDNKLIGDHFVLHVPCGKVVL